MHKKMIFILACVLLFLGMSSCGYLSRKSDDNINESGIEAAFAYTDPKIDMSLMIDAPGWRYSKDEEAGMVLFYEPEDYDGLSSFAISSNTQRDEAMTDANLAEVIDYMQEASRTNLTSGIKLLAWENADPVMAGRYEAARYTFSGELKSTEGKVRGDYLFWWTDERLYICSFITFYDDYDDYFTILKSSLETFKTYADIENETEKAG